MPEFVNLYSLATGNLEQRSIETVYGVTDLCKDAQQTDVYKIEKALSVLESHDALPSGMFRIKRRELNRLRHFLFVMHLRMPAYSTDHFSVYRTEDERSRRWIEAYPGEL